MTYGTAFDHVVGSSTMNRIGLPLLRISLLSSVYDRLPVPEEAAADTSLADLKAILDRDGIVVLPDFLPEPVFEAVRREFHAFDETHNHAEPDRHGTGVDWRHAAWNWANGDGGMPTIHDAVASNPVARRLIMHVLRAPVPPALRVNLQHLSLPPDRVDDRDVECVLHADRPFPCVKAFFLVEDCAVEDGAFVFAPGTHRLTQERLSFEHEFAVQYALQQEGRLDEVDPAFLERNRVTLDEAARRTLDVHPLSITGRRNTLIVANVCAFHARGPLTPGHSRSMIRMLCYDYQLPFYWKAIAGEPALQPMIPMLTSGALQPTSAF